MIIEPLLRLEIYTCSVFRLKIMLFSHFLYHFYIILIYFYPDPAIAECDILEC